MPLQTGPSHLLLSFQQLCDWLASITRSHCYRMLFRIHPTVPLEAWLSDRSFLFAVASKLVCLPLAIPLHPVSFSWKLFWPGAGGGGEGPGVGRASRSLEQLVSDRDRLHCKHHLSRYGVARMESMTPVFSVSSHSRWSSQYTFTWIWTAGKILLCSTKCIQSPSAGTRQGTAPLAAEVREKVEKYLCKYLSCK